MRGGAYQRAIERRLPQATVTARACPLFVAFAEEGWMSGPVVEAVAHHYLDGMFGAGEHDAHPDTLASRHALSGARRGDPLGRRVTDSHRRFRRDDRPRALADTLAGTGLATPAENSGRLELLATDDAERFARVGGIFLGRPLTAGDVEIVDLRDNARNSIP